MALSFWFDFASTYSYPAAMRIEQRAQEFGVRLSWNAFLLSRMFRAQGWNDSPFNLYPAKGRYMWRDLARICEAQQLPFRRPSQFPRNGLLARKSPAVSQTKPGPRPLFARCITPTSPKTKTSPIAA